MELRTKARATEQVRDQAAALPRICNVTDFRRLSPIQMAVIRPCHPFQTRLVEFCERPETMGRLV